MPVAPQITGRGDADDARADNRNVFRHAAPLGMYLLLQGNYRGSRRLAVGVVSATVIEFAPLQILQ